MKADPTLQHRLLDLQEADTREAQIAHRLATLPERTALDAITADLTALDAEIARARADAEGIGQELAAAEGEVEAVRTRAARNRARLDAGQGSAKDLQALTQDLESLAQRQHDLEEVELEVMERAERAEAGLAELEGDRGPLVARQDGALAEAETATAQLEDERSQVAARRAGIAAEIPADLLALYEKIRATSGSGAAALRQRRCEGCHLELGASDLDRVARAAEDDVLRCEECRRILVRVNESGL